MNSYMKCLPDCGEAMKLWLESRYSSSVWISAILRPGKYPQRKWTVRADWLATFVQTPEYAAVKQKRQESDPYIQSLQVAIGVLGNPDRVPLCRLGFRMPPRKVSGLMAYLGYEKEVNPDERRGRWFIDGVQTAVYRKIVT